MFYDKVVGRWQVVKKEILLLESKTEKTHREVNLLLNGLIKGRRFINKNTVQLVRDYIFSDCSLKEVGLKYHISKDGVWMKLWDVCKSEKATFKMLLSYRKLLKELGKLQVEEKKLNGQLEKVESILSEIRSRYEIGEEITSSWARDNFSHNVLCRGWFGSWEQTVNHALLPLNKTYDDVRKDRKQFAYLGRKFEKWVKDVYDVLTDGKFIYNRRMKVSKLRPDFQFGNRLEEVKLCLTPTTYGVAVAKYLKHTRKLVIIYLLRWYTGKLHQGVRLKDAISFVPELNRIGRSDLVEQLFCLKKNACDFIFCNR